MAAAAHPSATTSRVRRITRLLRDSGLRRVAHCATVTTGEPVKISKAALELQGPDADDRIRRRTRPRDDRPGIARHQAWVGSGDGSAEDLARPCASGHAAQLA